MSPRAPMAGRWELIEEQWEVVEPVLRPERRSDRRGRPWQDTRAVLNGVLWVLGTGAQWRELPEKYPPTRLATVVSSSGYVRASWKRRCNDWRGICGSRTS